MIICQGRRRNKDPRSADGRKRTFLNLIFSSFLALNPFLARAVEFEVMDKFIVDGASSFKSSVTITISTMQSASLWASTSTVTPHLYVSTMGSVGIGTASPDAALHVVGISSFTDRVYIPQNKVYINGGSAGQILKKNAAGYLEWGDAGVGGAGDNLGSHIATKTVDMSGFDLTHITTITYAANVFMSSAPVSQYGGVYVSTNMWIAGNVYIAGYVQDKGTDPGSITLYKSDFGKTFVSTGSAATTNYLLPSVAAADVGAHFTFVKLGTGKVTVTAAAATYIADSGAGTAGTIYNSDSGETYATVTLRLVNATRWMITGGDGSWTTTQ